MGIGCQEHEAPIPRLFDRGPPKQPPSRWTIFFPFLIIPPPYLQNLSDAGTIPLRLVFFLGFCFLFSWFSCYKSNIWSWRVSILYTVFITLFLFSSVFLKSVIVRTVIPDHCRKCVQWLKHEEQKHLESQHPQSCSVKMHLKNTSFLSLLTHLFTINTFIIYIILRHPLTLIIC